jgi:hypothetical protein
MENFAEGDPAIARYSQLTAALGGEPIEAVSKVVLVRLVSWSTNEDIATLAYLIMHQVGAVCQRWRSLVGELVPYARLGQEVISRDGLSVRLEIPDGLARRLIYAGTTNGEDES